MALRCMCTTQSWTSLLGNKLWLTGKKAGEIIVHHDEHPPQTPFQQAAEHAFPVLEIFPTGPCQASENLLAAIAAQTDDDIDAGRTEAIAVEKFNVLAIEK